MPKIKKASTPSVIKDGEQLRHLIHDRMYKRVNVYNYLEILFGNIYWSWVNPYWMTQQF